MFIRSEKLVCGSHHTCHAVVYAVCNCVSRFNPSPIQIKRVGFVEVLGVFCGFILREVQIDFTEAHRILFGAM